MFKFFKKKCPICKMELEDKKDYPESSSKKFCSEECKEKYRKEVEKNQSKNSGSCCH